MCQGPPIIIRQYLLYSAVLAQTLIVPGPIDRAGLRERRLRLRSVLLRPSHIDLGEARATQALILLAVEESPGIM